MPQTSLPPIPILLLRHARMQGIVLLHHAHMQGIVLLRHARMQGIVLLHKVHGLVTVDIKFYIKTPATNPIRIPARADALKKATTR